MVQALIAAGVPLHRNPASRFAFIASGDGGIQLFVDGQCYRCTGAAADLARAICASDRLLAVSEHPLGTDGVDLLLALCNRGSVAFVEEE